MAFLMRENVSKALAFLAKKRKEKMFSVGFTTLLPYVFYQKILLRSRVNSIERVKYTLDKRFWIIEFISLIRNILLVRLMLGLKDTMFSLISDLSPI